ncbi:MAG: hypothetical protein DBX46_00245 [Clostridiales bacterium]|nr:MAG: hypothetical protein DBX46_00245 [Clostridiales bacterium]
MASRQTAIAGGSASNHRMDGVQQVPAGGKSHSSATVKRQASAPWSVLFSAKRRHFMSAREAMANVCK